MERISNLVVILHSTHKIWAVLAFLILLRLEFLLDERVTHHHERFCYLPTNRLSGNLGVRNLLHLFAELANHFHVLDFLIFLVKILVGPGTAVVHHRSQERVKLTLFVFSSIIFT